MAKKQLQLIFDEVALKKQEKRDLNEMYKSALENMDHFIEIEEKIKALREEKKQIQEIAKSQLGRAYEKLEELKNEIATDRTRMTDVALNDLMKGVTVAVKDSFDNEYEPVWSVKFVKIK